MTICPVCHHKNLVGAMFCAECGAALVDDKTMRTRDIPHTNATFGKAIDPPPAAPEGWVTLHLIPGGQLISLAKRNEYTLGRASANQPIVPDVDLTPYDAYALGVSRLHAQIRRQPGGVISVMDMGSSNGTFLNGKKLKPYEEHPVKHGDIIALGKLKIQIIIS